MDSVSELIEFPRFFTPPKGKSFFLFGPRGTGKSTWIRQHLQAAPIVDSLAAETYNRLQRPKASPARSQPARRPGTHPTSLSPHRHRTRSALQPEGVPFARHAPRSICRRESTRIPPKLCRDLLKKSKFFFFDVGVFQALRPRGPLDSDTEVSGAALETLAFNELRALNSYSHFGYEFHFWRTKSEHEVDLVLYGERGLLAFELTLSPRVRREDVAPPIDETPV